MPDVVLPEYPGTLVNELISQLIRHDLVLRTRTSQTRHHWQIRQFLAQIRRFLARTDRTSNVLWPTSVSRL